MDQELKISAALEDPLHTEELLLNMGPQHPSTHGVLRIVVRTDGEMVRETWPHIGYLHRCFEKIGESLPYTQLIPYADRMDYLSSVNNDWTLCMAIEKLGGFEVPPRAEYLRVIAGELNRIASHLIAFGCFGLDLGAFTPFLYGFREREAACNLLEAMSGGRLLSHYARIGGVARDITPKIAEEILAFTDTMEAKWPEYNTLLTENAIFIKRTANVGIVSKEMAIDWGFTGPNLRGSGLRFDLRRDQPYSIYPQLEFDVPIGEGLKGTVGDSWDRFWVRMLEIIQSCRIIRQCLDGLPEGDIRGKVPKVIRLPKGEVYFAAESPRGELGFYVMSDGQPKAYRVKTRAPSFCSLSILNALARDCLIADIMAIVGGIDIVLGEVDR